MNIYPVIMAGGAGTRLWPLSREEKPKQFHNLSGRGTLLEETVNRLKNINPRECIVVTSARYRDISRDEMENTGLKSTILCEPRPRNTAAAVLYSALYLQKIDPDAAMIVLPADHHILDEKAFDRILKLAVAEAEKNNLVTIGIRPTYPETGYGYIKALHGSTGEVLPVEQFVEKPDQDTAQKYFDSGEYFWNSGIIAFTVKSIIEAYRDWLPEMLGEFDRFNSLSAEELEDDLPATWKIKEEIFDRIESIAIDKAILEKAENRVVIPADFGWADLGSWKAIDDILDGDKYSNRTPTPDNTIFVNSSGCSVFSEGSRIAVVGMDNVVVVQAGDQILVIDKEKAQDVRKVVDIIRGK